ncbi:MAG: ABC transporter ATP-binding protein [Anaerolineae bacterium]|nr:ABC transporter ATP-binding protein [Anaerolineae bacterium]
MKPVLETIDLTKHYPGKLALDRLNLSVQQGEIFGYLGPNGAGKSTTIRLLMDLIRPSGGRARILGMDTHRQSVAIKRHIGNLPAEVRLWDHLTGEQVLRYLCSLRPGCDMKYTFTLADRLGLDVGIPVRDYSTGNRRKLGLIQALAHRPTLLILDEPTTGLDPLVQQTFHDLMREIRSEGRTVFLSSHMLSEVESICDRVGILRDGRLKAVERISDLKRVHYRWVTLRTTGGRDPDLWAVLPGVDKVVLTADAVRLRVTGSLDPMIKQAAALTVHDMNIEEPDLEDIFLAFYGDHHD